MNDIVLGKLGADAAELVYDPEAVETPAPTKTGPLVNQTRGMVLNHVVPVLYQVFPALSGAQSPLTSHATAWSERNSSEPIVWVGLAGKQLFAEELREIAAARAVAAIHIPKEALRKRAVDNGPPQWWYDSDDE